MKFAKNKPQLVGKLKVKEYMNSVNFMIPFKMVKLKNKSKSKSKNKNNKQQKKKLKISSKLYNN